MQDHFRSDFADHVSLQTGEFWKQVGISKPRASLGCSQLFWGRGTGVEQKTFFGNISSSGEPSRYFPAREGSRFVRRWRSRAPNRLLQT
jgi:hypothetical protein